MVAEEVVTDWVSRRWTEFRRRFLPELFGLIAAFFRRALEVELVGYERHGRADRVKDVKAEIARVKKSAPSGRTTPNDSDTA